MISIIHPSRSRAEKSYKTMNKWFHDITTQVELIVSLDYNDTYLEDYKQSYFDDLII
jgi:hypothetical protein